MRLQNYKKTMESPNLFRQLCTKSHKFIAEIRIESHNFDFGISWTSLLSNTAQVPHNAIIAVFVCTRKWRYCYRIAESYMVKAIFFCVPLSISRCLAKNRKTLYIDCSQWLFEILWIWIVAKRPLMYYLCTGFWENKSTETALSYVYPTCILRTYQVEDCYELRIVTA